MIGMHDRIHVFCQRKGIGVFSILIPRIDQENKPATAFKSFIFAILLTGYVGKEVFNLPIWLRNGLSLEWHNTGDNVLITLNFLLFKLRQDEAKLFVAELKGKKVH